MSQDRVQQSKEILAFELVHELALLCLAVITRTIRGRILLSWGRSPLILRLIGCSAA